MVELCVRFDGEERLVYACRSIAEAAETMAFLREFLPSASYLVQPIRH